ncbi:hypothetical protein ACGFIZ_34135, partial [Micromonospora sp. NPDC048830]
MSTDPGQQRIDNQAGAGSGNPDAGATHQELDMDWQPSPAVTRTDADTLPAGDTLHHPADEPPTTPTPLHPDQPQPQPTADSWVRDPDRARRLFEQHVGHITTTTQQQEQPLRELWNALINSMDGDGLITVSEQALADATSTLRRTVHDRIVALRDRRLLQVVPRGHGSRTARYKVTDPGQPRQAPLPALPAGSQWVRNPDGARTLFNQHASHIATTTQQQEQPLRQLWNALIDRMDGDGLITVSEQALAAATSTLQPTVHDRIGALRDRGLLQLVREARGGVAARYRVTDPGLPRQALPALPAGRQWVLDRDGARRLFEQHVGHIATTTQHQEQPLRELWNALINSMDGDGLITVSEPALADATGTAPSTAHDRIVALRNRDLLWLDQEARGGVAAGYRVTDPGQPRQALPALPAGSQWVRNPDGAWTLFEQHVGHIATTTEQRDQLRRLWNVLIDRMDGDGIITASVQALADAAGIPPSTAHDRIVALRDRGLLQLVREGHGRRAARYRMTDPDPPRQAPVPGPAPEPDRPQQGEDLSWRYHGDTSPMSGPVPAPPAGTGLPGLPGPPGPLDDPDASTASSWPMPGPVPAHGAAMSTDFGQPLIDNRGAGDGSGNRGNWAWQVDPADPLDLFDPLDPAWGGLPTAVGTEPVPWPQPTDPSRPQAPPDPWSQPSGDQPSQLPGTQSFPPGLGVQNPAPQSPMPGPVPAPPAGTGLPGLPGPLDDPNAPTASSWP